VVIILRGVLISLYSGVSSVDSVDELAHAAEGSSQSEDPGREVCFFCHSSFQTMFLEIINFQTELEMCIVYVAKGFCSDGLL
jgi:hypothetical protein